MKFDLYKHPILDILEKELKNYQENILECLEKYPSLEKLDVSSLVAKGFNFKDEQKGLIFINYLRSFFHGKQLKNTENLWIIKEWGGIGSFQNKPSNEERIAKFEQGLNKKEKELKKDLFSVISSLSKIASFKDNESYFVYDSKAVYSLNWLILKNKLSNPVFFPMPDSRSKRLTLFDLSTLINLTYKENIQEVNWRNNLYLDTKDAYFIYCNLIKELNKRLFPNHKPYYLEMLLFVIADDQIFKDLKSSVNITIK